ncbi:MICOS complex subunit MIC25 [Protopterus annectens]|uniref:MICOS complex subunit MIC25 n=1 Tax=Protopterus annectens TaxID=7888 RepID=UPI001CFC3789|nr:MICOS complex subunit MIC25 [Protopterus annectens]
MGNNGSASNSNKRVSFGLEEEERVRVLQGIRLSGDVVKRMKETTQSSEEQKIPTSGTSHSNQYKWVTGSTFSGHKQHQNYGPHQKASNSYGHRSSEAEDEIYQRYELEQSIIKEELDQLAKRDKAAVSESKMPREKAAAKEERQQTSPADMDAWVKLLEKKEEELKHLDDFYEQQLLHIEKKNVDLYKLTLEQFHEAADKAESHIKKRNSDPLCMRLQNEISRCYQRNKSETLKCADLAKDYIQCVKASQKVAYD